MTLAKLIRRAVAASPRELAFRGRQAWRTRLNELQAAHGRSLYAADGGPRSLGVERQQLGDWWQQRTHRGFVDAECHDRVAKFFAEQPDERAEVLHRADELVQGQMRIFSHPPVPFTRPDRWHRDPFLNVTAPEAFYGRIEYLDASEVGDSKHVWEPNRFGWVYPLGTAFLLSGGTPYARTFVEWTTDWFARNPYPRGVNYCSALELGFRGYAWLWALDLFQDLWHEHDSLLASLLQGIWIACRHIEDNLSMYFSANTHLTGEAFALFACGAMLPEFSEAQRWRSVGLSVLAQEADKQFHVDGLHRENSSCYHLYSTDFYLHAVLIGQRTGFAVDAQLRETATRLARRLAELAPRDLVLPQFNDCDGGRLTWFASHPLDAAPSLAAASSLDPRFPYPRAAANRAGYDLWMTPDSRRNRKIPQPDSADAYRGQQDAAAAHDSGIVSYGNEAGDYLLLRSGPFGYLNYGHSHDAPTSFVLHLAGRPVVVDAGTGAYTQSEQTRNAYRQANGKNILLINGRGPSEPDSAFRWNRISEAELLSARPLDWGFRCHGRHTGFTAVAGFPVTVERELLLLNKGILLLIDHVTAAQPVEAELTWTLHPRLEPSVSAGSASLLANSGEAIHVSSGGLEASARQWRDIPLEVVTGPYSSNYGDLGSTSCLRSKLGRTRQGLLVTAFSRVGAISLRPARSGELICSASSVEVRCHVSSTPTVVWLQRACAVTSGV